MADYSVFINRLSELTGLRKDVLAAWVQREQGTHPGNVLGVTSRALRTPSNPHGLVNYANQREGAEATARLIQSSPNYAGIRASAGGTSAQQALAIAKSPWRLGPSGVRAQPNQIDPYYFRGFVQAGILGGTSGNPSIPSGGTSTPIMPMSTTVAETTDALTALQAKLKAIGIPSDPNHKFTKVEALLIANKIYGVQGDIAERIAQNWTGRTVAEQAAISSETVPNTITDIQNAIPNIDIPGALMFMAVILVGITFIILGGIIVLRKPK